MKLCDKCKVARAFLFYAPNNESNEFLCLECAQQTIQETLVVFHDVITSMIERKEPEPLPHSMTIRQLLAAITDAATSMTPEEKAEFRKVLDGERAEQDGEWMAHHWRNRRNPDVLSLDDSDYKFLREMKVKL